ncbi:SDR family oxidoreductase [Bacillus sp. KH172YL63]|uniref:SDR family oxidoreductase n=1 Tax=Bacillus sp. KH172YL63 TaxID=2709784 RepID=UPI0013E42834|nr:SDR family oxidoreductase [Bacillus sp. KH172YL63]BCB03934.1 UDP-glucose 4-epimerase [Bacillus sp. KH172YL63]
MNVLITGAAGYLGNTLLRKMIEHIDEKGADWNIVATDIRGINLEHPHLHAVEMDIRSPRISDVMKTYDVDTVVHLASIVTPGKKSSRAFEYSVDVLGTENVLKACVKNQVKRIVLTSSGAAYGYHPDQPEWLTEDDPVRGNEEFAYSYHKRLVEEMLSAYRDQYPELQQVIFRIGTILGDGTNNQITALFDKKLLVGVKGSKTPFVFIWDQDVVEILLKGVTGNKTGIFNVAGDGAVTIDEIASLLKKKVIRFPAWLLSAFLFILKRLSLTAYGEEQVNFLRYRPVLDNSRLKHEFGYTPALTSKEVFLYYMENKGFDPATQADSSHTRSTGTGGAKHQL